MIRQRFFIAVTLVAGTACCNLFAEDTSREKPDATNKAEDALTIRIKPIAKSYKASEPVRIVCTLANNSKSPFSIIAIFVPYQFTFYEITDPNGAKVRYSGPKWQFRIVPRDIIHLKPDTSYSKKVGMTGASYRPQIDPVWYDLTTPGQYKLRVIWRIPKSTHKFAPSYNADNLWVGEIVSNEVTFRVE